MENNMNNKSKFTWTDQRDVIGIITDVGFTNYNKRHFTSKCVDTTTGRIVGKILKIVDDEGVMYEAKYIQTFDSPTFYHVGYFINTESAKTAVESKFNPISW
jgi:hypothetical protein